MNCFSMEMKLDINLAPTKGKHFLHFIVLLLACSWLNWSEHKGSMHRFTSDIFTIGKWYHQGHFLEATITLEWSSTWTVCLKNMLIQGYSEHFLWVTLQMACVQVWLIEMSRGVSWTKKVTSPLRQYCICSLNYFQQLLHYLLLL